MTSFSVLPHFYLTFVFTIIHGSRRQVKNPGGIHQVSGLKVDIGGEGLILMYVLNLKASFLLIKMNSFDHAKVWSPKQR